VVLSLRRCVQILTAARHDIRLRWHKSSGSVVSGDRTWDLWIKGPKGPGGGMIRYHITALWG